MITKTSKLRNRLERNTNFFRKKITEAGFNIKSGIHPIIPIMIGDAQQAKIIADDMLNEGIYVIDFSYPVVPKNESRIRVQISAGHTKVHLNQAIDSFAKIGKKHNIIK